MPCTKNQQCNLKILTIDDWDMYHVDLGSTLAYHLTFSDWYNKISIQWTIHLHRKSCYFNYAQIDKG